MTLPRIAPRDEWLDARKELLEKEKALTRERDGLNVERRNLPMVKIEKDYVFEGLQGEASLLDLFEGRKQLIVGSPRLVRDALWVTLRLTPRRPLGRLRPSTWPRRGERVS